MQHRKGAATHAMKISDEICCFLLRLQCCVEKLMMRLSSRKSRRRGFIIIYKPVYHIIALHNCTLVLHTVRIVCIEESLASV